MSYKNDYYYDLDIENFFESNNPTNIPTEPGLVNTKPQGVTISTSPRMNADGKLKDKLKKFVQSDKGKKILKLAIGGGVAIAFGPQLIAALGPVMPAMKLALSKKGIAAKGPLDIIKKFKDTQLQISGEDKKNPAKIVQAIFGFFKAAKERRAAGTASPVDELILKTADTTIQKISDGTLSVDAAVEGEVPGLTPTPGTTKAGVETTTEKKAGLNMPLVLIILVAVFFLSKK
jgi:hypothetical protein